MKDLKQTFNVCYYYSWVSKLINKLSYSDSNNKKKWALDLVQLEATSQG